MNTILLQPNDVLFFRDGRPMEGSLAGHGAAWPMPNVINHAFHAALHRAAWGINGIGAVHVHRQGGRGNYAEDAPRDRKFGSLLTAGPFPVRGGSQWFFPRPLDLLDNTLEPGLLPTHGLNVLQSSLPDPLEYAVANRLPPAKDHGAKPWLSRTAFEAYLGTGKPPLQSGPTSVQSAADTEIYDAEHSIGIAIDPDTGTTGRGEAAGKLYSAHYLRLRESWRLGVCAAAPDKQWDDPQHGHDLVRALFNGNGQQIVVGGQQRICSAQCFPSQPLPFPRGAVEGFRQSESGYLVKWILLSPAIWPAMEADEDRQIQSHPGGWLPNWIAPESGEVLLKAGDTDRREGEGRETWRRRIRQARSVSARLVAAIIPKPLVVTGWALPDPATGEPGGAQSAHLAVPAGAVYYFAAISAAAAAELATALNWHGGDTTPTEIKNRRSALLGEKGFGLGVCGTWQFFEDVAGRPQQ